MEGHRLKSVKRRGAWCGGQERSKHKASRCLCPVESWPVQVPQAAMCGDTHRLVSTRSFLEPWCPKFSLGLGHIDMVDNLHGGPWFPIHLEVEPKLLLSITLLALTVWHSQYPQVNEDALRQNILWT